MRPKSSNVSLREIAEETELSITTVSRVLRKRGEIAEETRRRVMAAAERMRYRPNMLVHGIRTGRTFTMGVMVPPYDSYWTNVLTGIHDELSLSNYVYIHTWCTSSNNENSYGSQLLQQLHRLIDRRVDGIILWAHLAPLYNEAVVAELQARDLPVVAIDHELAFADSVETDEKLGASLAAKHLLDLGHRHVAHLAWNQSYKWAQLRRLFFEQEIAQANGTCVTRSARNDAEVAALTREMLKTRPRPTAIYACSDRVAAINYQVIRDMGLRIPQDVSVAGFADLEFAQRMQPALTTIRQHGVEVGRIAARLLVRRAEGSLEDTDSKQLHVGCELIKRDSTGPAPGVS